MAESNLRAAASALLPALRNYLDITWKDPSLDEQLVGMLARCMTILDSMAGAPQEYEEEGLVRQPLFDYVRYVRAGSASDFPKNFTGELLMLRQRQEAAAYVPDADLP